MALALVHDLGPEPWGSQLRRMRRMAGFSQGSAAERVDPVLETSKSTVSNLEQLDEVPTDRRRRETAYLLCLLYGFDPTVLTLDRDDLLQLGREVGEKRVVAMLSPACITAADPLAA